MKKGKLDKKIVVLLGGFRSMILEWEKGEREKLRGTKEKKRRTAAPSPGKKFFDSSRIGY